VIKQLITRPIVNTVNGLLVALIAVVAFNLLNNRPSTGTDHVSELPVPAAITPDIDALQILLEANLFGVKTPDKIPDPVVHAPETSLNLILRGVVMTESRNDARVIISGQNGQDRSYGINDALPGNARITHIYANRVILLHNGVRESLQLSLPFGNHAPAAPQKNELESNGRATISGFREQFVRDPGVLADYISAEAVTLQSGQSGWRLSPGNNTKVFEQLGLKPGDLVMAINNVSAGSGMSRIALLNELATADQLELKILRQEKVLSFYFTMND